MDVVNFYNTLAVGEATQHSLRAELDVQDCRKCQHVMQCDMQSEGDCYTCGSLSLEQGYGTKWQKHLLLCMDLREVCSAAQIHSATLQKVLSFLQLSQHKSTLLASMTRVTPEDYLDIFSPTVTVTHC